MDKILWFFKKDKKKNDNKKDTGSMVFKIISQQAVVWSTLAILLTLWLWAYIFYVYKNLNTINQQYPQLNNLQSYNVNYDRKRFENYQSSVSSISDLLQVDTSVTELLDKYNSVKDRQSIYYNAFLQRFYFPSLNIWKNYFTNDIDITLIGQKFLNMDQFQDIPLIQYWSDFIKDLGDNIESNEISNITIGDINEIENDFFFIPIDIEFISPNKRAFLLLVDKLSTTSNNTNLSLLNEFFFYLLNSIQEYKHDKIEELRTLYQNIFPKNIDETSLIGYHLYQWIKNDKENILIDNDLINEAVKKNVFCDDTRQEKECFYSFREKYRNIPQIAYTLGMFGRDNKVADLKSFLTNLPPIITVNSFNFEKVKNDSFVNNATTYQGHVSFNAYGKSISSDEISEISMKLWEICFKEETPIDIPFAIEKIDELILQIGNSTNTTSDIVNNFEELKAVLQKMDESYAGLSNYQKTIKIFEVFRMLTDANICTM